MEETDARGKAYVLEGGVPRGGNRREGEGVLCLIVEATDARGRGCLLEATGTRQGVLRGGNRHQAA